ncbi:hypothetical protein [Marinobacter sp.]|uniref:hypothetical protein n=1 Tax=Marinobacter sp. TaxID=50741 RepID=UPI0025B91A0C|nr:hypothetical protein [Marinobacter sp.]
MIPAYASVLDQNIGGRIADLGFDVDVVVSNATPGISIGAPTKGTQWLADRCRIGGITRVV